MTSVSGKGSSSAKEQKGRRGQKVAFIPVFRVGILNIQVMHFPLLPHSVMVKADAQLMFDRLL